MTLKHVVLYDWPDSRQCLECEYGVTIAPVYNTTILGRTPSICTLNYTRSYSGCSKFKYCDEKNKERIDEERNIYDYQFNDVS